ncbi:MAG: nicotinate phosphoribosyltransferase, partial [Caldilineaceae bacterium]
GPLAMAQILETSLLNHLNYPILIASKAARLRESANGSVFLEFGIRRAHERGGNAGTRAALIGGADFTSNAGVSHLLGFPPKGTHAHALVQAFLALGMSEYDAFQAYADVYPDECLLLVDTINTLESGVPNAIRVFEGLRAKGYEPVGVRLDSGDLAYLSIQTAKLLDAAGFPNASIVLSNNLDELVIWQIATQINAEAKRYGVDPAGVIRRLVYGVGTRLITSEGDSSLGGVYKLVAVREGEEWKPAIKLSEAREKTPNPGHKELYRIYDERGHATADLVALSDEKPDASQRIVLRHPGTRTKWRALESRQISQIEPLLEDILVEGRLVYDRPDIDAMRGRRMADVERLDPGVRRLINPHVYHVSISQKLWDVKDGLIRELTGEAG